MINLCNCENSEFCDPEDDNIITGDLRLVKNEKLKKLFTKGLNFRLFLNPYRPVDFRKLNQIKIN